MDGTVLAESDAAALSGHTTTSGGSIVQRASGDLIVAEAVQADGSGNVSLSSNPSSLVVSNTVSSSSGSVELFGSSGVDLAASGDIQTGDSLRKNYPY